VTRPSIKPVVLGLLMIGLLSGLLLPVAAQEPSPAPTPAPADGAGPTLAEGMGGVRGTLSWTDRSSGITHGDKGARVWLFPYVANRKYGLDTMISVANGAVGDAPGFYFTKADEDGRFVFPDLEPGCYFLFAASAAARRDVSTHASTDPTMNPLYPTWVVLRQHYCKNELDTNQVAGIMFQIHMGTNSPLEVDGGRWSEFNYDFGPPAY